MSYKDPDVPTISNPVLLDKAIQTIQLKLATLSWLKKAFGRSYKAVELRDGISFNSPEIYTEDGEYLSMMPNDNVDSYCFFDVDDPQTIEDFEPNANAFTTFKANVGIVFYWHLERVDSTKTYRFGEELKKDVLDILIRGLNGRPVVVVTEIYEEIDNVFRGYTIDPAKTQLFKHPWQGMRFDCELIFREEC